MHAHSCQILLVFICISYRNCKKKFFEACYRAYTYISLWHLIAFKRSLDFNFNVKLLVLLSGYVLNHFKNILLIYLTISSYLKENLYLYRLRLLRYSVLRFSWSFGSHSYFLEIGAGYQHLSYNYWFLRYVNFSLTCTHYVTSSHNYLSVFKYYILYIFAYNNYYRCAFDMMIVLRHKTK